MKRNLIRNMSSLDFKKGNYMKFQHKTIVVAGLLTTTFSTFAQSNTYGELSYISGKYSEPSLSASPTAFRLIYGFKTNETLSYEGLAAFGISSGTGKYLTVNYSIKENSTIGVLAKGTAKLGDNVQAFGRFGYAYTSLTDSASGPGGSLNQTTSGGSLAYGAGLNFGVSPTSSINLDYMVYYNRNGISLNGFGAGYQMSF